MHFCSASSLNAVLKFHDEEEVEFSAVPDKTFQRQLPVRLLQLRVAGVLRHAQDFVVVVTFAYPAKMSIFV